ncbi:hypothetical protein [Thalassotalea euphylliae]|uniref:hypothetical protein n=1 Tax=Thalassotalea euphylliae TaxID=1655234 RepID=UPI0015F26531|nr:hypothetical protein [Thalassotalea euphylliae]
MKTIKTLTLIAIVAITSLSGSDIKTSTNKLSSLVEIESKPIEVAKFGRCLDFPLCRERI